MVEYSVNKALTSKDDKYQRGDSKTPK